MMQSANLLGQIVKALKDYENLTDEDIINTWFSKCALVKSMQILDDEINKINPNNEKSEICMHDLQERKMIAQKILDTFDFNQLKNMTNMGSHGDFCVQQLICTESGKMAVIDFEAAKKMPIVWEIMRSYSYIDSEAKDGKFNIKNLIKYFREFNKYVKLKDVDYKYAAHLYLIQLVGSPFGYREYNKDSTKIDLLNLGMFRTKMCHYLYENRDAIGRELAINLSNEIEI